jgi:hypothetical protein
MKLHRNFSQQTHPTHSIGTKTHVLGAFRTVFLLHDSRCKTGWTGAINARVRKTKLHQNFSQRTHPILSIGPKTHVLGCFEQFCYSMKVGAKRAELVPSMHKFVKWSCIGIFHNERTWFTPLVWHSGIRIINILNSSIKCACLILCMCVQFECKKGKWHLYNFVKFRYFSVKW